MDIYPRHTHNFRVVATLVTILAFVVFGFSEQVIAAETYVAESDIVIGEYIYADDYSPTTDDCWVTIKNPSGTTVVSHALMSADADGWHHYPYTLSALEGKWPAFIECGTALAGDLLKVDKTFLVRAPEITNDSVASSVWGAASRTLTSGVSIASDIWSATSRSLTSFGSLVSDVWSDTYAPIRRLTDATLTNGGTIAVVNDIAVTNSLISSLNNISAADVWSYGARSLTSSVDVSGASQQAIWDVAASSLSTAGSIGKKIADNLDVAVSTRGTSSLTAADVWSSATRTLTSSGNSDIATAVWLNGTRTLSDYNESAITAAIWSAAGRTLTNYGNDITAGDVWNVLSSTLTTTGSIGEQLATNVDGSISDVLAAEANNATLISSLNNISAADVWSYGARSLTSSVDVSGASQQAIWDVAASSLSTAGSIGKKIADNLDVAVSTRGTSSLTAADVWSSATRTLTSSGNSDIATAVWLNGTRTLSSYGNDITASDVWNVLSSSLTSIGSIGEQLATNVDATISSRSSSASSVWTVRMSDTVQVQTGSTYRAKVYVLNPSSEPTDAYANPTVTLYDPSRNTVVSAIPTTRLSEGIYEYTYTTASGTAQGLWEAVADTEILSGTVIQTNDYWEVAGSPAQVIINSVTASSPTSITGNITITNEGLSGYEYQYEWCVVSSVNNQCGGGDDAFYSLAAKYINPGESWNTALTAQVSSAGTYYFKLVVYFGADSSSASRVFTVTSTSSGGGGGGGGGGGAGGSTQVPPVSQELAGLSADLNKDGKVGAVDFSIMLAFWGKKSPFKNQYVDINKDGKVGAVDFSIMLYQWGKKIS